MTDLNKILEEMREERKNAPDTLDGRVLLVDALNSFIRCFAAVPTMNEDGEHVGGISGFLKSIGVAIRQFKPSRVVLVFDGKGGSKRRRKLYPEYKENRKTMTRLNRTYDFKDAQEEDESRKFQLYLLADLLKCLPVTIIAQPNVEADDVLAYLANLYEERGGESVIMSTDKDFIQLVTDKIHVWNPIRKKLYDVDAVKDEYGIHPNNFVFYRILDGDKADNIPGVKGVGIKTLLKNYPHLEDEARLSVEEIIDYAKQQEKGKLFERISKSEDLLKRNFSLMRLDVSQMSNTTRIEILGKVDKVELKLDRKRFVELLAENKMIDSLGNYDRWLMTTFNPLMRFVEFGNARK